MIILKSAREIDIMRKAGRIVAECHEILAEVVKPGISTIELDKIVEEHIRKQGAKPSFKGHQGFPASTCAAINDVICHGFPDKTILKSGDVITIDIGACYKGYHGDSGWTYVVGEVSEDIKKLMKVGLESLNLGIEQAVIGNRIGDIGYAIQTYAEGHKYGVVRDFCGHGIGKSLWEDPEVPHYGKPGFGPKLKEGMVIAIEPMITMGGWRAKVDSDGWTARTKDGSICVQFEHTLAITKDGPMVLTKL